MSADLYITQIHDPLRHRCQPLFDKAVRLRDPLQERLPWVRNHPPNDKCFRNWPHPPRILSRTSMTPCTGRKRTITQFIHPRVGSSASQVILGALDRTSPRLIPDGSTTESRNGCVTRGAGCLRKTPQPSPGSRAGHRLGDAFHESEKPERTRHVAPESQAGQSLRLGSGPRENVILKLG